MTPQEVVELLKELLFREMYENKQIGSISTFEDLAILTNDKGLILTIEEEGEYSIVVNKL